MNLLQTLIDAAAGLINGEYDPQADNTARVAAVRAALAEARQAGQEINLADLDKAAVEEFERIRKDSAHSPAALADLGAVVDVVEAVRAEQAAHDQALATMDDLAGRIAPAADTDPEGNPDGDPEGNPDDQPADQPGDQPDDRPDDQPDDDPGQGGGGPAQQPGQALEPALTAAGRRSPARTAPRGGGNGRVPLGRMPNDQPGATRKASNWAITAAADIPGVPMGSNLPGMSGLTDAVSKRLYALNRAGKNASAGIAVLERTPSDERLVVSDTDASKAIAYACDERRLPGGSLVAAAGWCAPPEQSYDFCDTAVVDGLVTIPTVTARRGSLTWPESPDFSDIYTGTGFYFTSTELEKPETGVGARADKPCFLISCPGTQSLTLDAMGLCLQTPILTERAYPELVEYYTEQSLAAHQHKINAVTLRQMEALATAVTLPGTNTPGIGPGAYAAFLSFAELQAEYLRARERLGEDATVEMIVPRWVRGVFRSDLSKRTGVDTLSVQNARFDADLRARGINPQWVLDWQDAFAGTATAVPGGNGLPTFDATGFGGNTPPTSWPATVKFMMFPAGTYFKATNDLVQIDGLYDSTLLKRNMHLALFTEEGIKIGKRCHRSLVVTVPICPNGATGGTQLIDCTNGAI